MAEHLSALGPADHISQDKLLEASVEGTQFRDLAGACSLIEPPGCLPLTSLLGLPTHFPTPGGHPAGSRLGRDGFGVFRKLRAEVQQ